MVYIQTGAGSWIDKRQKMLYALHHFVSVMVIVIDVVVACSM